MNRPNATRLRLCLAVAVITALAVIMPASASADFSVFFGDTGYPTDPTPSNVQVSFDDPRPGAHSDLTVTHNYGYTGVPSGAAANSGDDLKQWTLETPVGFYGNPSAIPHDKRCTQEQMNSYVTSAPFPGPMAPAPPGAPCPASAQVGTASLTLGVDGSGATGAVLPGNIYVVQSASPLQEVPTTLFTVFRTNHAALCPPPAEGCITAALSMTQIAPVTGEASPNYRLRAVSELVNRPDLSGALGQPPHTTEGHIKQIVQELWGNPAAHGNSAAVAPFQTNPTSCGPWESRAYSRTYGSAGPAPYETAVPRTSQTHQLAGTVTPGGGDTDGDYAEFVSTPTTPDCSGGVPPLTQTATGAIDNNARGANPGLAVTISNPNADNVDKASKLVTTLPSTITTNVSALANVCEQAQVEADACPAISQIGTAEITSPILSAKQYGRVYMTRGAEPGLPYLSIWVNGPNDSPAGAFKFRLDATTRFAKATNGPEFNRIETTFDKLPALPFDSFVVRINGGDAKNSLLINRECPVDGSLPQDGPIDFVTSGWGGSATTTQSPTSLNPCYGVRRPARRKNCTRVSRKLRVTPQGLIAKRNVAKVELLIGTRSNRLKRRATRKGGTFRLAATLRKRDFRTNRRYHLGLRVVYKDGHVIRTKTNTFPTCRKRR